MIIRKHNSNDLNTLVSFNCAMAEETEGKILKPETIQAGVRALLEDESKGFYLLAEMDDRMVGQLMITKEWSDWRNGNFWWIQSVYVLPDYRNKGVYRSLHEEIIKMGKSEEHICGIRLYVDKDNTAAQEVYKKMGMVDSHYTLFEEDWSDNG